MRLLSTFLSLLVVCCLVSAQQKYLVSPNSEVIPLHRGQSASQVIAKRLGTTSGANAACGTRFTFGYPEELFQANSNFGAFHKDVMAEWFLLPATGTIDTIFWEVLGSVGALDSTVYCRVHTSRIGPNYGPGKTEVATSTYYPAPCQSWGYYINTNDLERQVTPFIDDATDTNWVSTIGFAHPGITPTKPPTVGNSLWGGVIGVAVHEHAGKINYVRMLDFDTLKVTQGDLIFLSQRVKSPPLGTNDARTEFAASGFRVTLSDENYPARDWKFYEKDSGPSNCAGQPTAAVKRGWVARGGFGADSLDVAVFNYWYSMTVTSNVPPAVSNTTPFFNTFEHGPFTVEATITDCDPSNPGNAGVATAQILWTLDGVDQTPISMSNVGGDQFDGDIPAQAGCPHTISYKVKATDNSSLVGFGTFYAFQIVCFGSAYYLPDTGAACSSEDITGTGTVIANSAYFIPPTAPSNAVTTDDGTAGPFDIGGSMSLFSDDGYRYAWIGVNGAIALSKNATDTLDVNSNGLFSGFGFPYTNGLRTGRDTSITVMNRMPANFIAPYWDDLIVADTTGAQFGHIRYKASPGGDTCKWVAEWDSVGAFVGLSGTGAIDEERVRVVLNRCDGTIEYQYDNVGVNGNDTTCLVGAQGKAEAEYIFINQLGTPAETHPRSNWCIKLYPGSTIMALDSWNMVSVGVNPVGGNYAQSALYPAALGNMFYYIGSYQPPPGGNLSNGTGWWAKFSGAQAAGARGTLLASFTDAVSTNWNMIGTTGYRTAISSIVQAPPAIVSSHYFGYGASGYYDANAAGPNNPSPGNLLPGLGYWVKANAGGTLTLNRSAAEAKQAPPTDLSTLNRITIIDAAGHQQPLYIGEASLVHDQLSSFELPPGSPSGFDARYSSGRMVETYPSTLDKNGDYRYTIRIDASAYPVTIQWNVIKNPEHSLVLTGVDGSKLGNTVMNGSGALRLTDASIKQVVVMLKDVQTPKVYALHQNYPNPFNPTTRFTVDMPKTATVTVAIYDILGRQISTLMNGQQGAGSYTMEWDGRDAHGLNVPTGIYFIRMKADDFNATQKIMLMK